MNRLVLIMCFILMLFNLHPVEASLEIREKMAQLAARILQSTNNEPVTVGVFSHTGLEDTNSGPGLEQTLASELNRISSGIVRQSAKFEVKADYAFVKSRAPEHAGLKVVKLTVRIIEKEFSEVMDTIPLDVVFDHTKTLAELLQLTGALPPDGTKQERNEEIDKLLRKAPTSINAQHPTLVASRASSPYAVEVLTKPLRNHATRHASPKRALMRDGLAFVDIALNELYEIKVYNNSQEEVAVSATIDGLDVFHFSDDRLPDGQPKYTHFIVAANSTHTIVGWHKSLAGKENYLSFLVTEYGQGAVSQAGMPARGSVGVIHVQFAHCALGSRSIGQETGFGPPREIQEKTVERNIDPPHEFVTIRYLRPNN